MAILQFFQVILMMMSRWTTMMMVMSLPWASSSTSMWGTYKTALLHFDYLHIIALIVSGKTTRGASFPLHGRPLQILLYQQRGHKIIINQHHNHNMSKFCSINNEVGISAWFKLSTWKQLITFDIHKKTIAYCQNTCIVTNCKIFKLNWQISCILRDRGE